MKISVHELTTTALFSALIIVGAFLKIDIPLPLYTMHFTFQWFFVLMAGFILGAKLGALSVIVYIIIGLAGVPVFAAGGGPAYVIRPGFGFLLGFIMAAFVIGVLTEKLRTISLIKLLIPASLGMVLYYGVGAIYFYCIKNFYAGAPVAFTVIIVEYCLITVIPDFLLCVLAAGISAKLRPAFLKMVRG